LVLGTAKESNQELDGLEGGKNAVDQRRSLPDDRSGFNEREKTNRSRWDCHGCGYDGQLLRHIRLVAAGGFIARVAGAGMRSTKPVLRGVTLQLVAIGMATRHRRHQQRNRHQHVLQ
jgi:hypothetical protein